MSNHLIRTGMHHVSLLRDASGKRPAAGVSFVVEEDLDGFLKRLKPLVARNVRVVVSEAKAIVHIIAAHPRRVDLKTTKSRKRKQ